MIGRPGEACTKLAAGLSFVPLPRRRAPQSMRRLCSALLLLALVAPWREAGAEWVLTLYSGISFSTSSTLEVSQRASDSAASFANVSWTAHPFSEGAPYYGLRRAYFPAVREHVGAMLDFTHYKMYAETAGRVTAHGTWNGMPVDVRAPLGTFVQHLEIAHGVNFASLNGEYRWDPRFAAGPWQLHAGAGIGAFVPHAEGNVDDTAVSENYEYGGLGWQVFGGAEYALPPDIVPWHTRSARIALLLESKFDSGTLTIHLDPDTRVETHTATFHVISGVALHF